MQKILWGLIGLVALYFFITNILEAYTDLMTGHYLLLLGHVVFAVIMGVIAGSTFRSLFEKA